VSNLKRGKPNYRNARVLIDFKDAAGKKTARFSTALGDPQRYAWRGR